MAVKTSADIQIENKSYTNKDFSQIYPELLDLVKKLTNKWDPETTNESDPGLVLLKLLAFIADKNNYNIDKNILEQFMPSVTQEENMRKLCDMMGYNIGYYRSATTDISFTYLGGNSTLDTVLGINQGTEDTETQSPGAMQFHIKAFDTSFKTEDNIVYTLLEDIEITDDKLTDTKRAIQGQIKALNLNQGSTLSSEATKIQLYNLDENNRIYIPDVMVAENGIFINKEVYNETFNKDAWRRVDNLNDQELGSRVFKFGFDSSKNLPYIEFPSDISDLIQDGLEIYYIVSDGVEGSISPNTLTSFNTYSFDVDGVTELEDTCYSLNNATSVSASEPETIDEAYKNFRKTIGTFNTLVSCKDYSNYIYTYQDDETNNHVVSNVQALDLRTDPNKSINLLTRDIDGLTYYKTRLKDNINYQSINDVILHATKPYDYDITNKSAYETTYNLISDSDVNNIDEDLENIKTISHILTVPGNNDIAMIEARYALNINISTKYKVNVSEQSSILSNVRKALYNNFNSRQLDFGEEIPYDEIVNVIENADERIKLVVVDDPIITPYVVNGNYVSKSAHMYDVKTNDRDRSIVVENILGGRIQLYIKDESLMFDYKMDLSNLKKYNHLAGIKTGLKLNIPVEDQNKKGYKLKKNESIQIVEDSYISTTTYPAYVYFGVSSKNISTEKGVPYKLKENETLYIYYTDTNDVKQIKPYGEGTIIRTNEFALPIGKNENTTPSRWLTPDGKVVSQDNETENYIDLYALGTNETIEILKLNETVLDKGYQRCFWYARPIIDDTKGILNQKENDLIFYRESPDSSVYYHILEEDEVFIYPSDDNFTLFSVGAGTKLQVVLSPTNTSPFADGTYGTDTIHLRPNNKEANSTVIDLEELQEAINSQDISNFEKSYHWNEYDFRINSLHIIESTINTYIEGDELEYKDNTLEVTTSSLSLTSEWLSISNKTLCTSLGEKSIGDITNAKIRSLLSFTGSSLQPQQLESDEQGTQTIVIYYYGDAYISDGYYDEDIQGSEGRWNKVPLESEQYIQINTTPNNYKDIILRTFHYEEDTDSAILEFNNRYEVPYSCIIYKELNKDDITLDSELENNDLYGLISKYRKSASASRKEYSFKLEEFKDILPDDSKLILNMPADISNIYVNVFDQQSGQTHLFHSQQGKVEIDLSYISWSGQDYNKDLNILISTPVILNINSELQSELSRLENSDEKGNTLSKILAEIAKETTFDYLADLSNSKLISSYDLINSFFDYNNVYNPITLAKIDFNSDKFKCNIVASSRK